MPKPSRVVIRSAALAIGLLSLSACETKPVVLSPQFTEAKQPSTQAAKITTDGVGKCRVLLAEIIDKRGDPQAMGSLGGRDVRATDSVSWVRTGLESLGRNARIMIDGEPTPDPSDLVMQAELLKAYVLNLATAKSATVVLRIKYGRNSTILGEQLYRGTETGVNWASGEGETQSALNEALSQVLTATAKDVLTYCDSGTAASSDAKT